MTDRAVRDEPLHRFASRNSLAGRSFAEVGMIMKKMVLESTFSISTMAEKMLDTPVGEAAKRVPRDVLPLPLPSTTADEKRLEALINAGVSVKELESSRRRSTAAAWARGSSW